MICAFHFCSVLSHLIGGRAFRNLDLESQVELNKRVLATRGGTKGIGETEGDVGNYSRSDVETLVTHKRSGVFASMVKFSCQTASATRS